METQLKHAFIEGLGLDGVAVDWANLKYRGIPEWDSVAHMQLVGEIEDSFDVMLETDDVIDMNSYVTAKAILAKYGVDFS